MKKDGNWLFLLVLIVGLFSCTGEKQYIPKPSTYLELNFPTRNYGIYHDSCGYSYKKPSYFTVADSKKFPCNRNISFDSLNGTLFLTRININLDTTSLGRYINYAINKLNEHKIKATQIIDSSIVRPKDRVFGTFFELQGNVASPFQFYLTDSASRFISGIVYFNAVPNYDSIKPVLNFVKKDLYTFMETLKWEE